MTAQLSTNIFPVPASASNGGALTGMNMRYLEADRLHKQIIVWTKRGRARRDADLCVPCGVRWDVYQAERKRDAQMRSTMGAAEWWAYCDAHPHAEFVWGCEGCYMGLIIKKRERVPAMNEITDEDRDHELAVAMAEPRKTAQTERSAAMEQASQMRGPKLRD